MRKENLIALLLGLVVAILLWDFYLKPKYDIKTQNKDVLEQIDEAGDMALKNSLQYIEGEENLILSEETLAKYNDLNNSIDAEVKFHKEQNTNLDLADDPNKLATIELESKDITLDTNRLEIEDSAIEDIEDPKARITMIKTPVKSDIIESQNVYNNFLQEDIIKYPKVDFTKEQIVFVSSDGKLDDGFIEIADIIENEDRIIITYKFNIIGNRDRLGIKAYKVLPKTNKIIEINSNKN